MAATWRLLTAMGIAMAFGAAFAGVRYSDDLDAWQRRAVASLSADRWTAAAVGWSVRIFNAVLAGGIAYAVTGDLVSTGLVGLFGASYGTGAVAWAGAGILAGTWAGYWISLWVLAGAGVGLGARGGVRSAFMAGGVGMMFAVAGAATGMMYGNAGAVGGMAMILFLFLLPTVNGLMDAASMAVSRWLGRRVHGRSLSVLAVVAHTLVDLALAFVFLVLLAILLPAAVMGYSRLATEPGGEPPLDLHDLLNHAAADPLGPDGWWVTAMLVTTLVPTAIHLFFMLVSALAVTWPRAWRETLAARLESRPDDIMFHGELAGLIALNDVVAPAVLLALGGWVLFTLIGAALWPVSTMLLDVAFWSLRLVGG